MHNFFKLQIRPLGQTYILYAQLEACESHNGTIPTIHHKRRLAVTYAKGETKRNNINHA